MEFAGYRIVRKLAVGGMAELFLARQKLAGGIERQVVLKRVLPKFARNDEFIRSFLNEAQLAAQLNHPSIVQIFDVGRQGRSYFISMEYLRGYDAGLLLEWQRHEKKTVPIEVALSIVVDVLSALEHAHCATNLEGKALGIVHRDVTPGNIIVTRDGTAKVVDFGIAKATVRDERRTATGTVKGKIEYLSPEQLLGMEIDRRADVFAAGIVAYELLTNQHPFRGDTDYESIRHIVERAPVPIAEQRADLPAALCVALGRATERNLGRRFASCREFQTAIEEAASATGLTLGHSVTRQYLHEHEAALAALSHEARVEHTIFPRPPRRHLVWIGVGVFLLAGIAAGLVFWSPKPEAHEASTAASLPAVLVASMPAVETTSPPRTAAKFTRRTDRTDAALPGTLRLIIEPWAYVQLDGTKIGITPMPTLTIKPGSYTLTFSNPDLNKRVSQKIVVHSGQEVVVRQKLDD